MGGISPNTDGNLPVDDIPEKFRGVALVLERGPLPLLMERFSEPVRLTSEADKGDNVMYAIGRGPAGLVVEVRSPYGVSPPRALLSFVNHQPYVFETLDPDALASVAPLLPPRE